MVRRLAHALHGALAATALLACPALARADGPARSAAAAATSALRVPALHVLVFGFALVCVAFLVNRFAPRHRRRLRPTVLLFAAYAGAVAIASTASALHSTAAWPATVWWVASLLELLVAINLAIIVVFDVVVPVTRFDPPEIAADIMIGLAHILALFYVLHRAGLNLQGLIATSAVVSAVLGLALAPTIGNIFGGVALQLDNSVSEGDWIQLDANTQGRVKSIRWRHTVIETRNWDSIVIPNATLLSANITILGKRTEQPIQRRYWAYFNVAHKYPPDQVVAVVTDALLRSPIPNVASDPPPNVVCMDLARDGFASYAARFWIVDLARDDGTASAVRERIVAALRRAGIPLAVPGTQFEFTGAPPRALVDPASDAPAQRPSVRPPPAEHSRCVALLAKLELFRGLRPEELAYLAERATFTPFARGEVMTAQGQAPHWLYVLARGAADVQLESDNGPPRKVATLKAPDVFGEMAVMTGEPRAASVVATEPSECYRLDKDAFRELLTQRPEVAQLVADVLARRRSELEQVRQNLDAARTSQMMEAERVRLLGAIQRFFALDDDTGQQRARD